MSGLTFTLKSEPEQRLDLSILTPEHLRGLGEADISGLPIGTTRQLLTVGDVFTITMDDVSSLRFEGGSERFDRLGEGLASGEIVVEGDVGYRAGRRMSGGRLTVTGSAGAFAGSGMSGGFLEIRCNAGDQLGGPLAGEMAGMRGGVLKVGGSAGRRAGDRMRRGTIAIVGDVGENAGSRMIAGTLVVGGRTHGTPGRLMRRGTLILNGGAERYASTFLDNGPADLLILDLMRRAFETGPVGERLFNGGPMRRLGGDTAVTGLGEIFVPLR